MLFAQATEAANAATKIIEHSSEYGPMGFALGVFFVASCIALGIHFLKVVVPERDARIETTKKMANCMEALTLEGVKTTAILEAQEEILQKVDSRLSTIERTVEQRRCEWREANHSKSHVATT